MIIIYPSARTQVWDEGDAATAASLRVHSSEGYNISPLAADLVVQSQKKKTEREKKEKKKREKEEETNRSRTNQR